MVISFPDVLNDSHLQGRYIHVSNEWKVIKQREKQPYICLLKLPLNKTSLYDIIKSTYFYGPKVRT